MRHPLFLICLAAVGVTACSEDDPPPQPQSCPCSCTAVDPVPHCVNTQDCSTTADCPSGTVCAPLTATAVFPDAQGSDPLASCGSSSPSKRCQLPSGQAGRQTLSTGFEVPTFRLARLEGDRYAAFTWIAPEETHVVHCALFACPPVVSESFRDDRPFFEIENYASCALASKLFEPGEGVFDLGDPSLAFDPGETASDCGTSSPRFVHELTVGCWAYDKAQIIAATPLEPVSPAETFDFGDQFDLDCSGGADGKTCSRPDETLGVCVGGACRAPCVTQADCEGVEAPAAPDAGTPDAGAPDAGDPSELRCVKSGAYVGVCLENAETRTEVQR